MLSMPAEGKDESGDRGHRFALRLYVAGAKPQSARAVSNARRICEAHLKGRYALEIIDIYLHPETAERDQVIAVPVLVKQLPAPEQRLVGDLSNEDRVLTYLGIEAAARPT